MAETISVELRDAIKRAAELLKGVARRCYQAEMTRKLLGGSSRRAEREFGWARATVEKGLGELRTGIVCKDRYGARGNRRAEDKQPRLKADVLELVEPGSQADPSLKTPFRYTRTTAAGLRAALMKEKGWRDEELPCVSTLGNMLHRMGYRLRRVQKTKPLKKIEETDAIFANVHALNKQADADPNALRISVDVKARVAVGDFPGGARPAARRLPRPATTI